MIGTHVAHNVVGDVAPHPSLPSSVAIVVKKSKISEFSVVASVGTSTHFNTPNNVGIVSMPPGTLPITAKHLSLASLTSTSAPTTSHAHKRSMKAAFDPSCAAPAFSGISTATVFAASAASGLTGHHPGTHAGEGTKPSPEALLPSVGATAGGIR